MELIWLRRVKNVPAHTFNGRRWLSRGCSRITQPLQGEFTVCVCSSQFRQPYIVVVPNQRLKHFKEQFLERFTVHRKRFFVLIFGTNWIFDMLMCWNEVHVSQQLIQLIHSLSLLLRIQTITLYSYIFNLTVSVVKEDRKHETHHVRWYFALFFTICNNQVRRGFFIFWKFYTPLIDERMYAEHARHIHIVPWTVLSCPLMFENSPTVRNAPRIIRLKSMHSTHETRSTSVANSIGRLDCGWNLLHMNVRKDSRKIDAIETIVTGRKRDPLYQTLQTFHSVVMRLL